MISLSPQALIAFSLNLLTTKSAAPEPLALAVWGCALIALGTVIRHRLHNGATTNAPKSGNSLDAGHHVAAPRTQVITPAA